MKAIEASEGKGHQGRYSRHAPSFSNKTHSGNKATEDGRDDVLEIMPKTLQQHQPLCEERALTAHPRKPKAQPNNQSPERQSIRRAFTQLGKIGVGVGSTLAGDGIVQSNFSK